MTLWKLPIFSTSSDSRQHSRFSQDPNNFWKKALWHLCCESLKCWRCRFSPHVALALNIHRLWRTPKDTNSWRTRSVGFASLNSGDLPNNTTSSSFNPPWFQAFRANGRASLGLGRIGQFPVFWDGAHSTSSSNNWLGSVRLKNEISTKTRFLCQCNWLSWRMCSVSFGGLIVSEHCVQCCLGPIRAVMRLP